MIKADVRNFLVVGFMAVLFIVLAKYAGAQFKIPVVSEFINAV